SVAEYAAHRKVSRQAVYDALASGRITIANPGKKNVRIDPVKADQEWEAFKEEQHDGADIEVDKKASIAKQMQAARLKNAKWEADNEELEFKTKSGQLVAVYKVKCQWFELARMVRDKILSVPDRISAELAGMTGLVMVHNILTQELNTALQ